MDAQEPNDLMQARCWRVLRAVARHWRRNGLAPTFDEIRTDAKLSSKSVVSTCVQWLVQRKLAIEQPKLARSLRVSQEGERALHHRFPEEFQLAHLERIVCVPVIPLPIAAGPPRADLATVLGCECDETLPLNAEWLHNAHQLFAFDVRGDSMRGAHILDGDRVIVRLAQRASHNGQIVAAWLTDRGITLKHYFEEAKGDRRSVVLRAANPSVKDIVVPLDGHPESEEHDSLFYIIGTYESLVRRKPSPPALGS